MKKIPIFVCPSVGILALGLGIALPVLELMTFCWIRH